MINVIQSEMLNSAVSCVFLFQNTNIPVIVNSLYSCTVIQMTARGPRGVPYEPSQSLQHVTEIQLCSVMKSFRERDLRNIPPHVLNAALASLSPQRIKLICSILRKQNEISGIGELIDAHEGIYSSFLMNSLRRCSQHIKSTNRYQH